MKNRSGSYRKVLFDESILMANRELILKFITTLKERFENQLINEIDFTTIYLLFFIKLKYQKNYLQRFKTSNETIVSSDLIQICEGLIEFDEYEKSKLKNIDGLTLFTSFNLKGLPQSVCRAMSNWYLGKWDIVLSFKIPSSKTLLKQQALNKRILTLIVDEKRITTLILGKRDPLSFAIHDLMHADQFFNNPISLKGQLGFYKYINDILDNPKLNQLLDSSPLFKEEFEYVVSDMNAYIIHLLKSFVSCFSRIEADETLKEILEQTKMPQDLLENISKINQQALSEKQEFDIRNYFEQNQGYIL